MTDTTDDEPGRVRPFAAMLQEIQGGAVADEAAEKIQELVNDVQELGKKGEFVLKIVVEPMKNHEGALSVSGDVTIKPPRPAPRAAVFFPDKSGNLLRDDPRQAQIPDLRIAPSKPTDQPKDLAK